MLSLSDRIKAENQHLTPFAVPHGGTLGRVMPEPEDETRFPFQRDRDRIVHAQAFRRLLGKTQVFVAGEGDHYRTRLTHTLEVAQIARDMARTLGLNEDLAACLALAHDLGHPPFGHAGEEALDRWMRKHGEEFEHNAHSLRIVTMLEEHSSLYTGLNLNREVLEGLQKHRGISDPLPRGLSLEAQIVDLADEIAYMSHDPEDGLRAGLFSEHDLRTIPLAESAFRRTEERGTAIRGALIHLLVHDIYVQAEIILGQQKIRTLDDVYHQKSAILNFSEQTREQIAALRKFLWTHLYEHPSVLQKSREGQHIIEELCDAYFSDPPQKILDLQRKTQGTLPQAVKDYIAGMTDAFAQIQWKRELKIEDGELKI